MSGRKDQGETVNSGPVQACTQMLQNLYVIFGKSHRIVTTKGVLKTANTTSISC